MAPLRCLAVLLLLAPAAAAGTEQDPEVTDPAGDAALLGLPVPRGLEWADVRSAWFVDGGGVIRLFIATGGERPPQGEVGVTFRVGDRHFIAGYTVVPGIYAGGFLSPADADGDVPADAAPASVPGLWEGTVIEVDFPVEELGVPANATVVLAEPWAWSEAQASNGEIYRADRSATGRDFALAPAAARTTTPTDPAEPIPSLGPAALLALGIAALLRRR